MLILSGDFFKHRGECENTGRLEPKWLQPKWLEPKLLEPKWLEPKFL